ELTQDVRLQRRDVRVILEDVGAQRLVLGPLWLECGRSVGGRRTFDPRRVRVLGRLVVRNDHPRSSGPAGSLVTALPHGNGAIRPSVWYLRPRAGTLVARCMLTTRAAPQ